MNNQLPYQDKDGNMIADEVEITPALLPNSIAACIIPKPKEKTRTVFIGNVIPFFRGKGDLTIICGNCFLPLACNISEGQLQNIVIKCPNCDKYNDIQ